MTADQVSAAENEKALLPAPDDWSDRIAVDSPGAFAGSPQG